jgi:C4-dicarboxylate-specific signal transduction histidine kinase
MIFCIFFARIICSCSLSARPPCGSGYGELCQAITDLAVERDAPFSVEEFCTLNRCLSNAIAIAIAIADAVTEFSFQRDVSIAARQSEDLNNGNWRDGRRAQAERMFAPFTQRRDDKSGLGLGLTIARQNVSADGGELSIENLPGVGCAFTINMLRRVVP